VSGLVAAGACEIALGALLGFPFALSIDGSDRSRALLARLRIANPRRLRQLHLDLIVMGVLLIAAGAAVPGLPLYVALAIGVGGWTNALLFAPLMFDEGIARTAWFRAVTLASFVAVSAGWVALAAIAVGRL
jgi:hypothetical protein